MAAFFGNLRNVVISGVVLAVLLAVLYARIQGFDSYTFWPFVVRWLHVLSGVMWIGLLWYFNFVQVPTMPKIPDELKPAVGKFIAPAALFYFRMAAASTVLFGLILAWQNNYIWDALTIGAANGFVVPKDIALGIGMWMGIIMAYNVWFIIWPNQQKVLNIGGKYPDLSAENKAAAARSAMIFSRLNTLLSIPMLFAMVAAQNIY